MTHVATIGNATIICYDKKPILSTDPWFCDEDPAYFGSWIGSHKIPNQFKNDILNSKFLWFSHGHPDHINPDSLKRLKNKKILLPDHYGARIYKDLQEENYDVTILKDKKWYDLSENIRILCLTNWLQDSILLIEANNRLFINLNDSSPGAFTRYLRNLSKKYSEVYLMSLSGYGDADMINFYSESGEKIKKSIKNDDFVGKQLSDKAKLLGANNIIPFSSFHQYQRSDSVWAQDHTVDENSYHMGIDPKHKFIDSFSLIDCVDGKSEAIKPDKLNTTLKDPIIFGDNWSDQLSDKDYCDVKDYFLTKQKLYKSVRYIRFIVGKKERVIDFKNNLNTGVTFEVPRNSLMQTINYKIFDDLLIGNFMKTTLHGMNNLYENNFKYIIANWSDNGLVNTEEEFQNYLNSYKLRIGRDFLYYNFLDQSKNLFFRFISNKSDSKIYKLSKKIYNLFR